MANDACLMINKEKWLLVVKDDYYQWQMMVN